MRIELKLNTASKRKFLPMDYQYYIAAWIYKVLSLSDEAYATFLHEHGYGKGDSHLYKLFCFGRLNFSKPKIWREKKLFQLFSDEMYLKIAFDVNEAAANFIKGLFADQEFYLGDRFNGIDFTVSGVQVLPEPDFDSLGSGSSAGAASSVEPVAADPAGAVESSRDNLVVSVHYRNVTPWVVSYKEATDKYAEYLKPDHPLFASCVAKHLIEKYNDLHDSQVDASEIRLDISPEYKRSGFLIKPGSRDETRIVGNLCDFVLTAPIGIHKMIWNAGLCEKSSLGFGWVEMMEK
ncbi:MAG: CRISPR-associated endoribonuclease Cas6 [Bacteroidales bacterium]|jgi:CRISPR-associated endoribonuclease Cas6|nr:CRISPR-associated endoribonuclease Cas6 [Bacteroidales bacterium]MCI1785507.1 CRISPR-associated endoribonuclease Cas6 [Bacteroidales bacterium]